MNVGSEPNVRAAIPTRTKSGVRPHCDAPSRAVTRYAAAAPPNGSRRLSANRGTIGCAAVADWQAKVLTVSDGVVAGTREDKSGESLVERLRGPYDVVDHRVVEDGEESVAAALTDMADGF